MHRRGVPKPDAKGDRDVRNAYPAVPWKAGQDTRSHQARLVPLASAQTMRVACVDGWGVGSTGRMCRSCSQR